MQKTFLLITAFGITLMCGWLGTSLAAESQETGLILHYDFNRAEAERSVEECEWQGLEVKGSTENGDEGTVEFVARFKRGGQGYVQHELASFGRRDGRWLYLAGEINPKPPQRHVVTLGRNDPCSCGSGKKYKKCCGA